MSDSATLKADQLIAAPVNNSSASQNAQAMDDLFSGLGLGSYINKQNAGAIATGLSSNGSGGVQSNQKPIAATVAPGSPKTAGLSLEDKRRMLAQGESMQRIQNQPNLMPKLNQPPQPRAQSKDLTQSLRDLEKLSAYDLWEGDIEHFLENYN